MADASKPWTYTDEREKNAVYQQDVQDFRDKGLNEENAHRAADLFYDMEVHDGLYVADDPVYQELLQSAQAHWEEFAEEYESPQELAEERYKEIVISEAAGLVENGEFNIPTVPSDVMRVEPDEPVQPSDNRGYGQRR